MNETEDKSTAIEEKMRSVLSDPESMQKLMRMASALAGSGIVQGGNDTPEGEDTASEKTLHISDNTDAGTGDNKPQLLQELAELGARAVSGGKHAALLHALRPYLGAQKQERVDRMLKLMQLASLAEKVLKM